MLLAMTTLAVGLALAVLATRDRRRRPRRGRLGRHRSREIRALRDLRRLQVTWPRPSGRWPRRPRWRIGAFLAAPAVWAEVSEPLLGKAAPWFDVFSAYGQLSSSHPFDHLGQTLTASPSGSSCRPRSASPAPCAAR